MDRARVEDFCRRWKITEFAFFGSVPRDDFGPDSDVDVLMSFAEDAHWSLFDLVTMEDELSGILGRHADLVERGGVEQSKNWIRRRAILQAADFSR